MIYLGVLQCLLSVAVMNISAVLKHQYQEIIYSL